MQPEIKYAKSGDVNLAYQVLGDGPMDLVFVPGFVSHALVGWEEPRHARFLRRLASFSRLITFDKRGTGMSDPIVRMPSQRERVDDVRAVMDSADAVRAALFGVSEGGTICTMFAATYPQRAAALVTFGAAAKVLSSPDFPWGWSQERFDRTLVDLEANWADGAELRNPSLAGDERYRKWFTRYLQVAASPGMVRALMQMNARIDIRPVLPRLTLPALIMHRTSDRIVDVEQGRYLAAHIPGARLLELEGVDHWPWIGDWTRVLDEVERFLTGVVRKAGRRPAVGPEALTEREKEVIRLAVEGYSAPDIGKQLFISERTVESHLANAYSKLGVESRVQLARRAAEFDL